MWSCYWQCCLNTCMRFCLASAFGPLFQHFLTGPHLQFSSETVVSRGDFPWFIELLFITQRQLSSCKYFLWRPFELSSPFLKSVFSPHETPLVYLGYVVQGKWWQWLQQTCLLSSLWRIVFLTPVSTEKWLFFLNFFFSLSVVLHVLSPQTAGHVFLQLRSQNSKLLQCLFSKLSAVCKQLCI